METHTDSAPVAIDFLSPTAGWQAAARWNRATFDWCAKGWQQWLALMTTVPPQLIAPVAPRIDSVVPVPRAEERALARSSEAVASPPRGSDGAVARRGNRAAARKSKPKAAAKAGKTTKTRTRG